MNVLSYFSRGWKYAELYPVCPDVAPLSLDAPSWAFQSWIEGFLAQRDYIYSKKQGRKPTPKSKSVLK